MGKSPNLGGQCLKALLEAALTLCASKLSSRTGTVVGERLGREGI